MSIQAVGAVIDLRGIPPTTKLVLALLANAHNGHSGQCNPDQARLADEAGISKRSIQDHLGWLEEHGYIARKVTELGRGEGKRTDFELLFLHRKILPEHLVAPAENDSCSGSSEQLLRNPASGAYKDKPEKNRKEPERAREVFDHYNRVAAERGWVVHSSLPDAMRSTLQARIREHSAEKVKAFIDAMAEQPWTSNGFAGNRDFRASLTYICRPKTFAEHFDKLVPAQTEQDLLTAAPQGPEQGSLEYHFAFWKRHGSWRGRHDGFLQEPNDPDAKYPAALYAKYGLQPPEGAR